MKITDGIWLMDASGATEQMPGFHCYLIRDAEDVVRSLGREPVSKPVRGGTDGSRLTFMGIPCPNLGTGGWAFHGPYEHITVEDMDLAVDLLLTDREDHAGRAGRKAEIQLLHLGRDGLHLRPRGGHPVLLPL